MNKSLIAPSIYNFSFTLNPFTQVTLQTTDDNQLSSSFHRKISIQLLRIKMRNIDHIAIILYLSPRLRPRADTDRQLDSIFSLIAQE